MQPSAAPEYILGQLSNAEVDGDISLGWERYFQVDELLLASLASSEKLSAVLSQPGAEKELRENREDSGKEKFSGSDGCAILKRSKRFL